MPRSYWTPRTLKCKDPKCDEVFTQTRVNQAFHDQVCQLRYNARKSSKRRVARAREARVLSAAAASRPALTNREWKTREALNSTLDLARKAKP
jgi:hypothetical protein